MFNKLTGTCGATQVSVMFTDGDSVEFTGLRRSAPVEAGLVESIRRCIPELAGRGLLISITGWTQASETSSFLHAVRVAIAPVCA